jgi:cell wall-associated NlpC family hydrolase
MKPLPKSTDYRYFRRHIKNPRLLGPVLWRFWWKDVGANAMMQGQYGFTRPVKRLDKLAGYHNRDIKPGDLAIVSGIHVLIYTSNGNWIEASPQDLRVVSNRASTDSKRAWFTGRTLVMRWWVLEN